MSPTTRRPGRLRALAVVSALAVSMIAGAGAPSLADTHDAPGLQQSVEARENAPNAPWNRGDDGGDFGTQGWSWF